MAPMGMAPMGMAPHPAAAARVPGGSVEYFIATRSGDWHELQQMLEKLGRKQLASLGPQAVSRFSDLYRSTTADLAYARLRYPRNPVVSRLNQTVNLAHGVLYTERRNYWSRLWRFMAGGFPLAVRRQAPFVWVAAAAFVLATVGGVLWFRLDSRASLQAMFPDAVCGGLNEAGHTLGPLSEQIVSAVAITLNNIQVALIAFALGMLACVGTIYVLVQNGLLIGVLGAYAVTECHKASDFVALVIPHGTIELTIIVLAGAAGMRIGWAMLAPGRLRRGKAIAVAGGDAVRILIGTVPFFVVAGTVEGFVTPAGLPPAMNVAIGALLGILFWAYLAIGGRPGLPGAADDPHLLDRSVASTAA